MENLTFIIPIYNVEDYLAQCLNSVLNQTVRDHRAILVDDGSTDSSGAIADDYAKKYPDLFRVIHKKNGGLSSARNAGIELVETPFLTFLDSDDWLITDYVEIFHKRLSAYEKTPDLIMTLPLVYDQVRGVTSDFKDAELFYEIFTDPALLTNVARDRRLFDLEVSSCRRIIRTEFAKASGLHFPEGVFWEDVLPHFSLMSRAQNVAGIGEIGFYYRVNRPGQITSTSGKSRLQIAAVFDSVIRCARDNNWSPEYAAHAVRTMHAFHIWSLFVVSPGLRREFLQNTRRLYRGVPRSYFKAYKAECAPSRRERILVRAFRSRLLSFILQDDLRARLLLSRAKGAYHKLKRG